MLGCVTDTSTLLSLYPQGCIQELGHQQRLEAIWDHLEYSEKDRMDMAVKYSAEGLRYKMDKVQQLSDCEHTLQY